MTCYVCGHEGRDLQYIGKGLYRHKSRCKPGRKRWLESKTGKTSAIREHFDKQENRENNYGNQN